MCEITFDIRCMIIRLCEIEDKLDRILEKLDSMNGARAFGTDVLANVIGNVITR